MKDNYDELLYIIKLGKSASDNFKILDEAKKSKNNNIIWLHLENNSSPFVIISHGKHKEIPKNIIIKGAILCKQNSKLKNQKNVNVMYTTIKNVIKTDKLGEVKIRGKYNIVKV